LVKFNFK